MRQILIIEASGLLYRLVESLAGGSHAVLGAATFKAAVDAIQKVTPAAILVDLDLPGKIDVEKVCMLIKQVPRCRNVPLFLIGNDEGAVAQAASRVKASGFFVKPVTPAKFRDWFATLNLPGGPGGVPAPGASTSQAAVSQAAASQHVVAQTATSQTAASPARISQEPAPPASAPPAQDAQAQVSQAQVSQAQVSQAQVSQAQASQAQVSQAQVSQAQASQAQASLTPAPPAPRPRVRQPQAIPSPAFQAPTGSAAQTGASRTAEPAHTGGEAGPAGAATAQAGAVQPPAPGTGGSPEGVSGPGEQEAAEGPAGRQQDREQSRDAPPAVLFVDSGTGMLEMLREAEVYKYCAVVPAGSAQEAGVMLKIFHPAAMMIEVDLPDLAGQALCRFLKSVPAYEDIPIFLMSEDDEDMLDEPVDLVGASGFLQKPFDGHEFVMFLYGKGIVSLGRAEGAGGDAAGQEGSGSREATARPGDHAAPGDRETPGRPGAGVSHHSSANWTDTSAGVSSADSADARAGGPAEPAVMPAGAAGFPAPDDPALSTLGNISLSGNLAEQVEAILEFGRNRRTETVPVLVHILSGGNPDLIGEACWALGEIGDQRAVPELVMVLKRPEAYCVVKAVEALGKIGDPSAVPHLVACAAGCSDEIKLAMARALFRIGDTMARKGLEILSLDDNFAVATLAAQSLERLNAAASS